MAIVFYYGSGSPFAWRVWLALEHKKQDTPGFIRKRLVLYGIALVLGEIYLIFLFANLKWPRLLLFAAIVSWGVLLGGGVWYRAHGRRGLDVLGK